MTQVRTPAGSGVGTGTGAEYIVDATQFPAARTFDEVAGRVNRLLNVDEYNVTISGSSSGEVLRFTALDNGRIDGIMYKNGSTACDSSNGWRILCQNEDRSDAQIADFGVGSATNAAAADDHTTVAADAVKYLSNSLVANTTHFTKGDTVTVDVTEDGTAGGAEITVVVNYGSKGWSA